MAEITKAEQNKICGEIGCTLFNRPGIGECPGYPGCGLLRNALTKSEIESQTDEEKIKKLYEIMTEMIIVYAEEEHKVESKLQGFNNLVEQAVWWYCNDHCGSDRSALSGVLRISKHTPGANETGTDRGLATSLYEELADMME